MKRVFIVHGHDHTVRDAVQEFVKSCRLEPIVLTDQPNQGGTVIEKFERQAGTSDYAIVLLTADDLGAPTNEVRAERNKQHFKDHERLSNWGLGLANFGAMENKAAMEGELKMFDALYQCLNPRARQNVILELGFFIGRLGRQRVCILKDPKVEEPSDTLGIVTISTSEDWQSALRKELKSARMI